MIEEGEQVFTAEFEIEKKLVKGAFIIDGINKYWLDGMFGYYTQHDLFKTRNEAIDHLISVLEAQKDEHY